MQPIGLFLLINVVNLAVAWDSEQLEVFDVVDDVKDNFYALLNVSQDASNQEIKSAFRGLSLKLHPDKNLEVDTSEQFRNLVAVYDVLRSQTKRKIYDEVLVNGLPNWRSAVYYYRYVRKMGVTEACIILFVILTLGQYLVNWAAYLEKKFDYSMMKKPKKNEKIKFDLPKPSVTDTLPFQIPRWLWNSIISLPSTYGMLAEQIKEARKPPVEEPVEEPKIKIKTVRKRNKGFVVPEGPNFEVADSSTKNTVYTPPPPTTLTGGLWTDDDLSELIRLVKKYPQGSSKRWENIAEALGRSVPTVTYMANKMKENGYRLPSEQDEEPAPVKVKQKTKKEVEKWSQGQQKALEEALARYAKGYPERWERVAESVPNKTKEDCMLRYKHLAETLQKQREGKLDGDVQDTED